MYLYSILIENYERAWSIYIFIVPVSHNAASRTNHLNLNHQMPSFHQWSSLPQCFEEMRIDPYTFVLFVCLFVCIHQCKCKSLGVDSSIGQKSSCEEYATHTAKCILGGVFFAISKNCNILLNRSFCCRLWWGYQGLDFLEPLQRVEDGVEKGVFCKILDKFTYFYTSGFVRFIIAFGDIFCK